MFTCVLHTHAQTHTHKQINKFYKNKAFRWNRCNGTFFFFFVEKKYKQLPESHLCCAATYATSLFYFFYYCCYTCSHNFMTEEHNITSLNCINNIRMPYFFVDKDTRLVLRLNSVQFCLELAIRFCFLCINFFCGKKAAVENIFQAKWNIFNVRRTEYNLLYISKYTEKYRTFVVHIEAQ